MCWKEGSRRAGHRKGGVCAGVRMGPLEKTTFSREAPSLSNRPAHPWASLQIAPGTPRPNPGVDNGGRKEKRRWTPDSCEPVGGGCPPKQLSLQRPRGPTSCIYFPSTCCMQDPGAEIKEVLSLSLDIWGQQTARWWSLGRCCGGAWVRDLSWASGKTFLCEQSTRSAGDCGPSSPRTAGFVQLHLSAQAGGEARG